MYLAASLFNDYHPFIVRCTGNPEIAPGGAGGLRMGAGRGWGTFGKEQP